jgi:hypothetical protein
MCVAVCSAGTATAALLPARHMCVAVCRHCHAATAALLLPAVPSVGEMLAMPAALRHRNWRPSLVLHDPSDPRVTYPLRLSRGQPRGAGTVLPWMVEAVVPTNAQAFLVRPCHVHARRPPARGGCGYAAVLVKKGSSKLRSMRGRAAHPSALTGSGINSGPRPRPTSQRAHAQIPRSR